MEMKIKMSLRKKKGKSSLFLPAFVRAFTVGGGVV